MSSLTPSPSLSPSPTLSPTIHQEFTIDGAILAGNLIILALDAIGIGILAILIKYHSNSPPISIRRPWLLMIAVLFTTLYDILWAIDGNTADGVMSCGGWEMFDGIYYILFFYILMIRVFVFFNLNRKTDALVLFFQKKEGEKTKFEKDLKMLQSLQRISKMSFIVPFSIFAGIIHAIVFFIDWVKNPDLINLSSSQYLEIYPECYVSVSYQITKY
jgi:hypothetical protein